MTVWLPFKVQRRTVLSIRCLLQLDWRTLRRRGLDTAMVFQRETGLGWMDTTVDTPTGLRMNQMALPQRIVLISIGILDPLGGMM